MSALPCLSSAELLAYLKKTAIPSVLVEGTNDMRIYRHIEKLMGGPVGCVLPCGGRTLLLDMFKRRHEFDHVPLAFIADLDTYYFSGTPPEYSGIIWTKGYSIENDVIAGSRVEGMMDEQKEAPAYSALLSQVCEWFAFEISEHLAGRESQCAATLGKVLNETRDALRPEFLMQRRYVPADRNLFNSIHDHYQLALRGKTWLSLLTVILSAPKRVPKHSKEAVLEISLTHERDPDLLKSIASAAKEQIALQMELPTDGTP